MWRKRDTRFWQNEKLHSIAISSDRVSTFAAAMVFDVILDLHHEAKGTGVLNGRRGHPEVILARCAPWSGLDLKNLSSALQALVAAEMLELQDGGGIRIIGWDREWSPVSGSAMRMRRHRAKLRQEKQGDG